MNRLLLSPYSRTLVSFGAIAVIACLASSWYINRLQTDLARTVRQDSAGMVAAIELQVQLRHLRVHSMVLVADVSPPRLEVVHGDLQRVDDAIRAIHRTATTPEDEHRAGKIELDYIRYRDALAIDRLLPSNGSMADLAKWSDAHHMEELLDSCRDLADHRRQRMTDSLARSESQTAWAGRVLLALGFVGAIAGLLSGYVAARAITRQVAQLSVRVQAVQAHLDSEVGAMTVRRPAHLGELNEQLQEVVERVSVVCQRLQEQERGLLRAEQLAAVGQLAAGVAHEVRNPLTGVKLLLQAAIRDQGSAFLTPDRLHLLLHEIARIERTVQDLMSFAVPPVKPTSIDLRSLVRDAIVIVQSRAELKSIAIQCDELEPPMLVMADRDKMLSLVTNLLVNAIEASPVQGKIRVAISLQVDGMMQLVVSDDGPGFDASMSDKLFTPFATTKATGTGLGLTIAQRIATEHGGILTAANAPQGGAMLTLTLPSGGNADGETPGDR